MDTAGAVLQFNFFQKKSSSHAPRPLHSMNQSMVRAQEQPGDLLQKRMPDPNPNAKGVHPLLQGGFVRGYCQGAIR